PARPLVVLRPRRDVVVPGGEAVHAVVVAVQGKADLLQVVLTLHSGGGLADLLHGGQQQADEDGDDGDHHQQLDQREGTADVHRVIPRATAWNVSSWQGRQVAGTVPVPGSGWAQAPTLEAQWHDPLGWRRGRPAQGTSGSRAGRRASLPRRESRGPSLLTRRAQASSGRGGGSAG